jgi:charged multivesicular body protein 1
MVFPPQAIQQNHSDIAKIYAQNAIRKKNENLNLLRLASRIDAVSSRVQTAVTMRQVTGSMANVVKGMDSAMKSMDLEKVRARNDVSGNAITHVSWSSDICCHGPLRITV